MSEEQQQPTARIVQLDEDGNTVLDHKGRLLNWKRKDLPAEALEQIQRQGTAEVYYCGLCKGLMPLSHFPHEERMNQ